MPRLLGIDFGLRRVGLALTDPEGVHAFTYSTLDQARCQVVREIVRIVDEEMVDEIVLGWPLRSDNDKPSEMTIPITAFAEQLRERLKLPIHLEDERFTSYAATEALKETGWVPGKSERGRVDREAARLILEDYLIRKARESRGEEA